MSIKTQGTEVYFVNPSGLALVKLNCPTGVTGLGGAADQIEVTCLDATNKGFVQGLKNPAAVSIPFNFDPAQTSHQLLETLYEAGTTLDWMVALSDATTQPTVDSNGNFVALTGRTNIVFEGYIADLNLDLATNEVVRGTLTVQRSGSKVVTYKA